MGSSPSRPTSPSPPVPSPPSSLARQAPDLATTPTPHQQQQQPSPPYEPFLHNAALGVAVAAPLALLLPPRRGARQVLLGGAALWAGNRLVADWDAARRWPPAGTGGDMGKGGGRSAVDFVVEAWSERNDGMAGERQQQQRRWQGVPDSGSLTGGESGGIGSSGGGGNGNAGSPSSGDAAAGAGNDRYADQARRDREVLDQGGGIGEIIMAQVREVWRDGWRAAAPAGSDSGADSRQSSAGDGDPGTDRRGEGREADGKGR